MGGGGPWAARGREEVNTIAVGGESVLVVAGAGAGAVAVVDEGPEVSSARSRPSEY